MFGSAGYELSEDELFSRGNKFLCLNRESIM